MVELTSDNYACDTNSKLELLAMKRGLSSNIDKCQCASSSVYNITAAIVVWPFRMDAVVRSWTSDLTKY